MAERRMFAKSVVCSDNFMFLPAIAQVLYFQLLMNADDDGFCDNVRKILKLFDATIDDLNILISNGYIIEFENGIIAISHWGLQNRVAPNRKKATIHVKEQAALIVDEFGLYVRRTDDFVEANTSCSDPPEDATNAFVQIESDSDFYDFV